MKKILLAALNARYSHSNPALLYLRRAAEGLPFDVQIAEFSINKDVDSLADYLIAERPSVIGLSVYIWNSLYVKQLIPIINKHLPECIIILGGPDVSFSAHEWLREFPYINYIITGPGEAAFRLLLEQNLEYHEKIISGQNPHFSEIPFPYIEADFTRLANRYIYYESTRGCPFACSFCLSSRRDTRLEYRKINDVQTELNFLVQSKPRYIKFVDRTFNANKKHSQSIWQHIIDNYSQTETCFHFEIFPQLLDDEDFLILKKARAGLLQFEAGIQSIHESTLEAVNRKSTWIETKNVLLRLLHETNIHLHVDLIAGLPFENLTAFAESFNEVYGLHAHHFQPGFLKVLPGTEIRERKDEFGLLFDEQPPYAILSNKWLSVTEIELIHNMEHALNALYNSFAFNTTLEVLEEVFGSPFNLFQEITLYIMKSDIQISRDRYKWVTLIQDFIAAKNLKFLARINDALKRDKLIM